MTNKISLVKTGRAAGRRWNVVFNAETRRQSKYEFTNIPLTYNRWIS